MHGGKRNGSGRPRGATNLRTRGILEAAIAGGEMPIAYMLRVMRDENAPDLRRDAMAKSAAAYMHSKLSMLGDDDAEHAMSPEPATPESEIDPQ
jgi:hypothetical protein